ncbi:MAG: pyridoxal-phosphate dependent enzyme [Saprospiraceae bacterium]|nr:pyridoxal-phosphate dependent enzyme [Saprospiraceae bacterium]
MEGINLFRLPSPVERINLDLPVEWYVKRDDLIHPEISGNKYRKLKFIIRDVVNRNARGIITFGGCFSNHIHAVAAFSALEKIPSVGIIRGEKDINNPTLRFASNQGMKLYFIPRSDYRLKLDALSVQQILMDLQEYYIVPEGGDHPLAFPGVAEIIKELSTQQNAPDYLALAAGTGSTAAALISEIKRIGWSTKVVVITAVHDQSLALKIANQAGVTTSDFIFFDQYCLGGYAKSTKEYLSFIQSFYSQTSIPLDPVYNGKVVFGLFDLIKKGYFKSGSRLVWLHTGGLQGIEGFNYKRKTKTVQLPQVDLIAHRDGTGGGHQDILSK